MSRDSFIMYMSFYDAVEELTTEEKGILMDAVFKYHAGADIPELPKLVKMVFSIMSKQFDRDAVKYQKIVERNRDNGGKGGRSKNPVAPSGTQWDPNKHDDDDDNDSENKNENKDDAAADPAKYDRELNDIIKIYFSFFKKGKSKSINQSKVKAAWQRAVKKYSAIQIGEILRKAWRSDYLMGNGELSWILDHLEEIHFGKYDNHKQTEGNQVYEKLPDGNTDDLQF